MHVSTNIKRSLLWLGCAVASLAGDAAAQVVDSEWVHLSASGNLLYQLDERGLS